MHGLFLLCEAANNMNDFREGESRKSYAPTVQCALFGTLLDCFVVVLFFLHKGSGDVACIDLTHT